MRPRQAHTHRSGGRRGLGRTRHTDCIHHFPEVKGQIPLRTFTPKPAEVTRTWHVIDATDVVLGRLASQTAILLRGKHKPTFAPHVDTGDFVIIINAEKVALTGAKLEQKKAYRHSGFPGGLQSTSYTELLAKSPSKAVEKAVRGMLPKNSLGPPAADPSSRSTRRRAPARGPAARPLRDHPGCAVSPRLLRRKRQDT